MARAFPAADTTADRTGAQLAGALLGYFALVTLVITLSPFDFAWRPLRIWLGTATSDVAANVALFLPLGFLLRSIGSARGRPRRWEVPAAAAFSVCIEIAQIFIAGRFVAPADVAANTGGAWAGAMLRDLVERAAIWRPQTVGRIGLDVPLVGLLYLLVPQLWLSGVGLLEDPRRSATTLLVGCAGSIILVALHRHQWRGGVRLAAHGVLPLALLWFAVGALPALAASPAAFAAIAGTVLLVTVVLARGGTESGERRFESETLGRFLPVFMAYLVLTAVWPPLRPLVAWHGAIGFANRLNDAGVVDLLLLLEQVGGFTLLGYAVAEWRGRRELTLAADLPRIALLGALFGVALELVQGVLAGPGASLLRAVLSMAGAMYGAAVYHLARAHVRALRAEPLMAPTAQDAAA